MNHVLNVTWSFQRSAFSGEYPNQVPLFSTSCRSHEPFQCRVCRLKLQHHKHNNPLAILCLHLMQNTCLDSAAIWLVYIWAYIYCILCLARLGAQPLAVKLHSMCTQFFRDRSRCSAFCVCKNKWTGPDLALGMLCAHDGYNVCAHDGMRPARTPTFAHTLTGNIQETRNQAKNISQS